MTDHLTAAARHAHAVREHTTARDRAIVAAHRDGASIHRLARETGLARQSIQHIVRRDTMDEYGTLTDYTTGASIRPATADEHAKSLAAGETGAYEHPEHGAVFVAGGPEGTRGTMKP